MLNPAKGHAALRRGRWSVVGASYFLTLCTEQRQRGLASASLAPRLLEYAQALDLGWHLRAAVVLPDHIHLLVELGATNGLSAAIRRFKGRTAVALRDPGLRWQRGYFDHRMRATEDLLPVFLYLFLNPYRAGLVAAGQRWPAWFCAAEDWAWFGKLTECSCPLPEWLA